MPENFDPKELIRTVIALPLLRGIEKREDDLHDVIIDINLEYPPGRDAALQHARALILAAGYKYNEAKPGRQYIYATLTGRAIRDLVARDANTHAIFRIWPDFEVSPLICQSISTVKADAARRAFASAGRGIVWAVLDSGIDSHHAHFSKHGNLVLPPPLRHIDFTGDAPLTDPFGHGTHVAGILAGELGPSANAQAIVRDRDPDGEIRYQVLSGDLTYSGMAPECKLVSMKVLNQKGRGQASSLIAALEEIQRINDYGRRLLIHGVNLSVGYEFDPEWFACGQSPLCIEVDRLVGSGVVVVTAAGNTGYGSVNSQAKGAATAGLALTINDPGNAQLAITVGSTHRDMPHVYGVSYFSSKGPTGDGRLKPDLVAPGERIVSCGAGAGLAEWTTRAGLTGPRSACYLERSGTSMAAPHVSGAIAAFL